MKMSRPLLAAFSLCAILMFVIPCSADIREKTYNKQWGSGYAWSDAAMLARLANWEEVYYGGSPTPHDILSIKVQGRARASLLTYTRELIYAQGVVKSDNDIGELYGTLRIMEYTIGTYSKTFPSTASGNYSFGSGSRTFFDADSTFWVGPVPVTVSGSIGGGYSFDIYYELNVKRAKLHGGPRAWGNGNAWAGVDLWLAGAGVGANIKVLDAYLKSQMLAAFLSFSYSGSMDVVINPLAVDFYINAWLWDWKFYETLAKWSTASYTYNLFKF